MTIFVVQIGADEARLIEAKTRKGAVAYALPVVVRADKASAADVAQLMANGVKLESAE